MLGTGKFLNQIGEQGKLIGNREMIDEMLFFINDWDYFSGVKDKGVRNEE